MGYNLVINGVYWEYIGVITHLLTISLLPGTSKYMFWPHPQTSIFQAGTGATRLVTPEGETVSPKVKPPTAGHKKHTGSSGGVDSVEPVTSHLGVWFVCFKTFEKGNSTKTHLLEVLGGSLLEFLAIFQLCNTSHVISFLSNMSKLHLYDFFKAPFKISTLSRDRGHSGSSGTRRFFLFFFGADSQSANLGPVGQQTPWGWWFSWWKHMLGKQEIL